MRRMYADGEKMWKAARVLIDRRPDKSSAVLPECLENLTAAVRQIFAATLLQVQNT